MRKMNQYNGNDPGFFTSTQRATACVTLRSLGRWRGVARPQSLLLGIIKVALDY